MAYSRKFGAFGGVFTPSILTILGVIMYLRLPWIVGQAGMFMTLGIILVAHVISVTTGLSVASISTDKKVEVGGNYYIISRSLGLPIGGTLGIALFVGLSFSISLYVIGFIESFLPAWGLAVTQHAIRLYGTLALLAVAGVILASTSLAIRIQYVIMATIGLSLLSIVFGRPDFIPATPLLAPPAGGVSLTVLFGIFFPAVTGFTAGVQMSGDLDDPRKAIPVGTIGAILVGFLVYIGLTVLLAYRIDADALVHNTNILAAVSAFPPLLLAGVWGATLSSAMGSLLGAPRILQATSSDRITPRVFAKGYGPSNEPRNALILSFLIAEGGILMAELNLIAAIISIFFITTYGFINLSYAIENWGSSDFRPSFRIPAWVSIIGAAACFLVMIQLDLPAFLGASLILTGLYTYLKKKELTLESGDTWEGVWSSVIRAGLHRLSRREMAQRNWRPNIILFSGGTRARPYLIEFGKWLVDKRGFLSNFDLKENPNRENLFSKTQSSARDVDEALQGIFHRQFECHDVYEGMKTIAQVYGFSGVEPNTLMMGWARHSRDPERFVRMVRYFTDLDYNLFMLAYDHVRGFGAGRRIDVWWQDGSNNAALALMILKFLKASEAWQQAQVRILIVIEDSAIESRVYKNMMDLLDAQRIEAATRIVNNAIENRTLQEIIRIESKDADLTVLSIPAPAEQHTNRFIEQTNAVVADLGATLLVRASSYFDPLSIGLDATPAPSPPASLSEDTETDEERLPPLPSPAGLHNGAQITLFNSLMTLYARFERAVRDHASVQMAAWDEGHYQLIEDLSRLLTRHFLTLERRVCDAPAPRARRMVTRLRGDSLFQCRRVLDQFHDAQLPAQQEHLAFALDELIAQWDATIAHCPREVPVVYRAADLEHDPGDTPYLRYFKWRHRLRHRIFHRPISVNVRAGALMDAQATLHAYQALYTQLESIGVGTYRLTSEVRKWVKALYDALGVIEHHVKDGTLTAEKIEAEQTKLARRLKEMKEDLAKRMQQYERALLVGGRSMIRTAVPEIARPDVNRRLTKHYRVPKSGTPRKEAVRRVPASWARNQHLMIAFALMDAHVMVFQHRLQIIMSRVWDGLRLACEKGMLDPLLQLETGLRTFRGALKEEGVRTFRPPVQPQTGFDDQAFFDTLLGDIQPALAELPASIDIMREGSFRHLDTHPYDDVETVSISLRRQVDYVVDTQFLTPLQHDVSPLFTRFRGCRDAADDVVRLIQFQMQTGEIGDESLDVDPHDSLSEIITDGIDRIAEEREHLQQELDRVHATWQERLQAIREMLNPYRLTRAAEHLRQDIRSQESRKIFSRAAGQGRRCKRRIQTAVVRLLYRRSEGILLARKLRGRSSDRNTPVEKVLDLVESVSLRPATLSGLPFYYRQLFLGKQPIRHEFWVKRPQERRQAEQAVQRFRRGFSGGLLVLGEAYAGKTALCRRLAETWFPPKKIHYLFAPEDGTADPEQFKRRLETALQAHGDFDALFQALPGESVLIINDLELWWERSREGFAVIDTLLSLIDRYGSRCLFIVNTNPHSFRFINAIKPVEDAFLSVINCKPFDAEDLQQAILLRHGSTGLPFEFEGQPERQLSDFTRARLFTEYFDYASGNVGVALRAWIGHIRRTGEDRIWIRAPVRPDTTPLEQLDWGWMVWLLQFVLHKHFTRERLHHVFRLNAGAVQTRCQTLKRAGLIIETRQGVLELNPYVQPFVLQALQKMEML